MAHVAGVHGAHRPVRAAQHEARRDIDGGELAELGIGAGCSFKSSLSPVDLEKFWQEMKDRLLPKLIEETSCFIPRRLLISPIISLI